MNYLHYSLKKQLSPRFFYVSGVLFTIIGSAIACTQRTYNAAEGRVKNQNGAPAAAVGGLDISDVSVLFPFPKSNQDIDSLISLSANGIISSGLFDEIKSAAVGSKAVPILKMNKNVMNLLEQ